MLIVPSHLEESLGGPEPYTVRAKSRQPTARLNASEVRSVGETAHVRLVRLSQRDIFRGEMRLLLMPAW